MLGDAVDCSEQFVHAGDHCDLWSLASATQPPVVSMQPWIDANRDQNRHPQRAPESSVAQRDCGSPGEPAFSGLVQPRHHAYITGQRRSASEASGIAGFGDDPRRGEPSDALNGSKKLTDLVRIKPYFDLVLELGCPSAEHIDVHASVSNLQLVGLIVMLSDRRFGRFNERKRESGSDASAPSKQSDASCLVEARRSVAAVG